MEQHINTSLERLRAFCEAENFKGYDPFDGLNSRLFQAIPFLPKSRIARLAWIQFFKRSPVNFRPWVGIKKDYNPKAMGLFLSGYCRLYEDDPRQEYLDKMQYCIEKINQTVNNSYSGACWGYNFDWQARAFFQPKNTPTVVASVFVASALLDAFEITGDKNLMKTARSTCDFILKDLNRTYDQQGNFAFSYSPLDKSVVFNASLLGSRLLSRVYGLTGENTLIGEAKKSVEYCCNEQHEDGSWGYGKSSFHQWIDNFHTGYNLECIADFMKYSGDNTYKGKLELGFTYYMNTFFTEDGIAGYYNNSIYPIDIHAPAQMVITMVKLGRLREYDKKVKQVLDWTITNMQSPKGYFYYQVNKYFSSKISYIRWAQAWMFYALTTYKKSVNREQN